MTVREMKKRLIGRRIVGFEAGAFRDGRLSPGQFTKYDRRPRGFLDGTAGRRRDHL